MGTVVSIDVRSDLPADRVTAALDAAERLFHDADAMFSTYRDDSWISRLTAGRARLADAPQEVTEVLDLCRQGEELTDGWFTARWRGDGSLDPTGLVKGWAAREAGRLLTGHGAADHCVNAAGDIALSGRPAAGRPWRVGLADPRAPGALLGAIDADGVRAVATSGIGERGRHVIDPGNRRPATGLLAATVVGRDAALADALATGLVAAGRAAPRLLAALRQAGWRALLLTEEGALMDPDGLLAGSRAGR